MKRPLPQFVFLSVAKNLSTGCGLIFQAIARPCTPFRVTDAEKAL